MGHEKSLVLEPGLSGLASMTSWGGLKGASLYEASLSVTYFQSGQ